MKVHIVTSQKSHNDKIVFLLDDAATTPKTPKGYRKARGSQPFACDPVTEEQLERLRNFYTRVIDNRTKM